MEAEGTRIQTGPRPSGEVSVTSGTRFNTPSGAKMTRPLPEISAAALPNRIVPSPRPAASTTSRAAPPTGGRVASNSW